MWKPKTGCGGVPPHKIGGMGDVPPHKIGGVGDVPPHKIGYILITYL